MIIIDSVRNKTQGTQKGADKMRKYMAISKEQFEAMFTEEQQDRVKETLKAYDEVHITYQYGEYHFSTGVALTATYAPDFKAVGSVYADDIFTEEERILNYMESFHEYSPLYKGRRNYRMLNEIGNDWSVKFKMQDGEIVRA